MMTKDHKPYNMNPKRTVYQWTLGGDYVGKYVSVAEASRQTGIPSSNIYMIFKGKSFSVRGFIFTYEPQFPGYTARAQRYFHSWNIYGDYLGYTNVIANSFFKNKTIRKMIEKGMYYHKGILYNLVKEFPKDEAQRRLRLKLEVRKRLAMKMKRLTEEQKYEIIDSTDSVQELAERFGVYPHVICHLKEIPYRREDYYK